ncbi:MAG: AMP-binding protein [Acidimicrobiia bacterium]
MPRLVALDLPGGAAFVAALQRVWDDGDAVAPLDRRMPDAARARVLEALAPAAVIDGTGEHQLVGGRPVEPGDALVVVTSGTTGAPKGVVLTHEAVAASARATSTRIGVAADDHWLACLPLAHIGGLSVITRALTLGTPLTVLAAAEPAAITAAAHDGATLVSLVATMLRRIDPALFRVIVLGGSRPPADRPANTVATYGMTETGSGVVYDGRPLEGVEVRIDAAGEIHLRGPMLLRCYRDGVNPLDSAGWFATGDLGSWQDDGRLQVAGRRGDLIITGGENVWPEAVEAVLRDHPAVDDVAIAGNPDDEWGQIVTAYVVPADTSAPPVLDTLRNHVKQELPAYCAPRRLVLVEAVPRTALGKIRRGALDGLRR